MLSGRTISGRLTERDILKNRHIIRRVLESADKVHNIVQLQPVHEWKERQRYQSIVVGRGIVP